MKLLKNITAPYRKLRGMKNARRREVIRSDLLNYNPSIVHSTRAKVDYSNGYKKKLKRRLKKFQKNKKG